MDECLVIANEIMQKLKAFSENNNIPIEDLFEAGISLFLETRKGV